MAKDYNISTTFWLIFHSLLRNDDPGSVDLARSNCIWLSGELGNVSKYLLGVEPTLLGIVHDHWITNREAPSIEIIESWLSENPNPAIEEALGEYQKDSEDLKQYKTEDLGALLNRKAEEARRFKMNDILSNMRLINEVGVEIKRGRNKETYKGPDDATRYFIQKMESGTVNTSNVKTHGILQESRQEIIDYYESVKRKDTKHRKIPTGLFAIDDHILFGKGNFIGVLGYTGNRKSSFCRSWVYNAALDGYNTLHVSLEMSYIEEVLAYALIHSHHPKWGGRYKINYKALSDGLLTREEENFLYYEVLPDLEKLPGKIMIRQPTESNTWESIKTLAEVTDRINPFDIFFIDYLTLCDISSKSGSEKERHEDNIKDAKQWALGFRDGEGVLFLTPIQGNREGYEEAEDNEGRWDSRGIYMYSEFEKSSDGILTVFLNDDLVAEGQIVIGSCKFRRADTLKPQKYAINCSIGYVSNLKKHAKDDKIIDDIIEEL